MQDVKAIILANMEDTDRADRILAALKKYDGKLLSEPVAKKIAEAAGEKRVYISRQFGMCHLQFGGYGLQSDPDYGVSLLLVHQEKNVFIDVTTIEEKNAAYFSAAKRRNEQRTKALADETTMQRLSDAIQAMNDGWKLYKELTAYGTPLSPDMCSLDNLIDKDLRNRR